jgi:hypothetical protein
VLLGVDGASEPCAVAASGIQRVLVALSDEITLELGDGRERGQGERTDRRASNEPSPLLTFTC